MTQETETLWQIGQSGNKDWIDYLKLDGVVAPQEPAVPENPKTEAKMNTTNSESATTTDTAKKKSYVMTSMTGMQDYSYWSKYTQKLAKKTKGGEKSFRRGRIWA